MVGVLLSVSVKTVGESHSFTFSLSHRRVCSAGYTSSSGHHAFLPSLPLKSRKCTSVHSSEVGYIFFFKLILLTVSFKNKSFSFTLRKYSRFEGGASALNSNPMATVLDFRPYVHFSKRSDYAFPKNQRVRCTEPRRPREATVLTRLDSTSSPAAAASLLLDLLHHIPKPRRSPNPGFSQVGCQKECSSNTRPKST